MLGMKTDKLFRLQIHNQVLRILRPLIPAWACLAGGALGVQGFAWRLGTSKGDGEGQRKEHKWFLYLPNLLCYILLNAKEYQMCPYV